MYNIDQLNAMEADRVRSIAAEMGMKKAESADRQEAEYFILDNQAITSAKEIAEKSVAQPKKRGRKPKAEAAAAPEAAPAKRGRKPKAEPAEAAPAAAEKPARKPRAKKAAKTEA